MKKIFITLLFSIILSCVAVANHTTKNMNPQEPEVFFVLLSQKASIQPTNKRGVYLLSLKGVNPEVSYFSDSPSDLNGKMEIKQFVKEWKDGSFKKAPPNAMVETIKMDHRTKKFKKSTSSYAMTLNDPTASADYKDVTFKVKALPGSTSLGKLHNGYVAVFIDGLCVTCIGG